MRKVGKFTESVSRILEGRSVRRYSERSYDEPEWNVPAKNERIVATDSTIKKIVRDEIKRLGNDADLNHIDVSNVHNMNSLFKGSGFNGDISGWDVSKVWDMSDMFYNSEFTGNISSWNVSKVTDMNYMFAGSAFKGDISGWDVPAETYIDYMFQDSPLDGNEPAWYFN